MIRATELPLWFWLCGYAEFVARTGFHLGNAGLGIPALLLFGAVVLLAASTRGASWRAELAGLGLELRDLLGRDTFIALAFVAAFALLGAEVSLGLFASLAPPHLPQEYDGINYQLGLPRQLLVRGGLAGIGWSTADLWPMALQWGLAPFSFAFGTINKVPELVVALGIAPCMYRLAKPHTRSRLTATLPVLAFFGAHGVMIQVGMAMMDLPAIYLLLLGALAVREARLTVAALAFAVYAASKAFHPFHVAAMVGGAIAWLAVHRDYAALRAACFRFAPWLVLFSALLLARSASVSLAETGTPLFPFATCGVAQGALCAPATRPILDESARELLATRDRYGNGRGPRALALHLWRVAVPTLGVNNEFDYPLGLPWLLLLTLLAFALAAGAWHRPFFWLAVMFWGLWWESSHQSRWLYPVLAFGFLATLPEQERARRALPPLLALALALAVLSQARGLMPTARLPNAELRAREEAKVRWASPGVLASKELLYVNEPALDHVPGDRQWVLR